MLEDIMTDLEGRFVGILGAYQRDLDDPVYDALEAAMGALGNARGVIQKRRSEAESQA